MRPSWKAAVLAGDILVQRKLLLDKTFVSDLDEELRTRRAGPARRLAASMGSALVVISVITLEEFYEKRGEAAARDLASRFTVLGLHAADALCCGLLQTRLARRLGENDAWLAAQALRGDLALVTRDRRFADVPKLDILTY